MNRVNTAILAVSLILLFSSAAHARHSQLDELLAFQRAGAAKINTYLESHSKPAGVKGARAIISFLLEPDGRISDVRAVRESGELRAVVLPNESSFRSLEKTLVRAVARSSPLKNRPSDMSQTEPVEVLYIYQPGNVPIGTVEVLPLPKVPKKGVKK